MQFVLNISTDTISAPNTTWQPAWPMASILGESDPRWLSCTFPAAEKMRSTEVDIAGNASLTTCANFAAGLH